jgi:hypothetical protein
VGQAGVGSGGLLSIDVGRGSSFAVNGGGTLTNNGTVRVVAGANTTNVPAGGQFSPISAGTWAGTSGNAVQAVGGTWNTGTNVFTASDVTSASGAGGATASISDLTAHQRMLISDTTAGTSLGVSFLDAPGSISLTGTTVTGTPLSSLEGLVPTGQAPLDAWNISTTGFSPGNPAYLSLLLGAGYSPYQLATAGFARTNLSVWDYTYNGSAWSWTELPPNDLTFDGTYASFTATALNDANGCDYAIVGTPLLDGDANRDGRVDINDLTVVLTNYDQSVGMSWSTGDFIGDGTVDINDLTIVLTNYNTTVASGSAVGFGAVPEPGTLLLLAASLAGLLACAWRKRK